MQNVKSRWYKAIPAVVCAAVLTVGVAVAQQGSGSVKGTIADQRGKALQGASVTIRNLSETEARRAQTDGQGHYSVSGLKAGKYEIQISDVGFGTETRIITVGAEQGDSVNITLSIASVAEQVVVESDDNSSLAVQQSVVTAPLDSASARSEISSQYIREFTTPMTDFSDITQAAPGTVSYSNNGIGNGQAKTWFRGFKDGMYTMTWDGVPFQDSNDPTHHSWAYVPAPAISYVDFDRSPGTASDIGPANFGGSIHMFSPKLSNTFKAYGGVSYGSNNSKQYIGQFNTGLFGSKSNPKANFWFEGHHQDSDGYQTNNFQQRTAATAKFNYKYSERTNLTLVGTTVIVDANTPNSDATRRQIQHHGDNYLLDSNYYLADGVTVNTQYYKFYNYHVPTNFEVATFTHDFGNRWKLDSKSYTYGYSNHQHYVNNQDQDLVTDAVNTKTVTETMSATAGTNKLNQYERIGEIATVSYASRYGVFRTGSWYEFTTTNRYQIGTDPRTWVDSPLLSNLKFHEHFITSSVQPFAEFQYVGLPKWTITAGIKDAYYRMHLKQYADGKTIGVLGCTTKSITIAACGQYVVHDANYNSWLPSFSANYRINQQWAAYGQYGRGSVIPPSSTFDVTGAQVSTLPKPTIADTYQGGVIAHMNRIAFDADVFHIHFNNSYVAFTDSTGYTTYSAGAPSNSTGFEAEGNIVLVKGLSLMLNQTLLSSKYEAQAAHSTTTTAGVVTNYAATPEYWVEGAAHDTETASLIYQNKGYSFGFINKRVGTRWDKASKFTETNGTVDGSGQNIEYSPFWSNNIFLNYTLRKNSFFDNSKIKLSINNLFDSHDLLSISSTANKAAPLVPYTTSPNDQIVLQGGRTIMASFQIGLARHQK